MKDRRTRRLCMLNGSKLLPGDIVLSTQRSASSWVIRGLLRSAYSHAAIILDGGLYAEAVGLGVRVRSIRTILKERLLVRRLKSGDVALALRAAQNALAYVHAGYANRSVMLALFRSVRISERNRLFCSHLVATAYAEAGQPIVNDLAPDKTTPADLERSDALQDVAGDAVLVPRFFPAYLAQPDFATLSDRETVAVQSIYADLVPWFAARQLEPPKDWAKLLRTLADMPPGELQTSLDRTMLESAVRYRYFKLPGDALRECVAPLARALAAVDRRTLPLDHVRTECYLFEQAIESLRQQLDVQRDNHAFFLDEHARTGLGMFEMLALNARALAAVTERMIALSLATLHALHAKYPTGDAALAATPPGAR